MTKKYFRIYCGKIPSYTPMVILQYYKTGLYKTVTSIQRQIEGVACAIGSHTKYWLCREIYKFNVTFFHNFRMLNFQHHRAFNSVAPFERLQCDGNSLYFSPELSHILLPRYFTLSWLIIQTVDSFVLHASRYTLYV